MSNMTMEGFIRRWFPFQYGRPPEHHRIQTEEELREKMMQDLRSVVEGYGGDPDMRKEYDFSKGKRGKVNHD